MMPLLLVVARAGIAPTYGGIAEDWREGFVAVGRLANEAAIAESVRAARQVIDLPDGFAVLNGRTVTVYARSRLWKRTDARFGKAVFAGWMGMEPVLRTGLGALLLPMSGSSALPNGMTGSQASIFQAGRSPIFSTFQNALPETWRCEATFGKKSIPWGAKKGSIVDQTIVGRGFLVSSEAIGPGRAGELTLFRLGHRPSTLLRKSNVRVLIGRSLPNAPLWISIAHYRRPLDHVAWSSVLSELSPSGKVSRRFSVPFEFRPFGLDDSRTWLLGIRMRGLHAGASELIAIRLKDRAVKTLRSSCVDYVGLP
ncbi:MAG: hypothetical protein ACO1SV_01865 [Fimbriimonas sp.]